MSITSSQFITHDGSVWVFRESFPDADLFGPISIGNNVFIGAGCIILPGVKIGDNVIVGAGSIVKGTLESGFVYAGVPARPIKSVTEYWASVEKNIVMTKSLPAKRKKEFLLKNIIERVLLDEKLFYYQELI